MRHIFLILHYFNPNPGGINKDKVVNSVGGPRGVPAQGFPRSFA
jgi:hypothetical protein